MRNGTCVRVIVTAIDIARRKAVEKRPRRTLASPEKEIAARTAVRDQLWRNAQDFFLSLDFDGVMKAVNPLPTRTLGRSSEEIIRRPALDFVHPEDHDLSQATLSHARPADLLVWFMAVIGLLPKRGAVNKELVGQVGKTAAHLIKAEGAVRSSAPRCNRCRHDTRCKHLRVLR